MARRRNLKSISTPIIMGAVSVPLSVALLVGWTLIIARNLASADDATLDVWLLVAGALSFVVIAVVLFLLSFYLVREILEVRRQDSFIDSVTHELKSPLASIRLGLETIARPTLPAEKHEALRNMMLEDVSRLSAFIDDVLQASRLANYEEASLTINEIDLHQLAQEVRDVTVQRWHLTKEQVQIDIPDDFILSTDEAALTIVLRNLVDNAVKYGGENPQVEIRGRRDKDDQIHIEVEDHGIGIESGHLKRVFHRFFRVASPAVRSRHGTGLGLFVVSALARSLGGRISAYSEGLGRGTTMHLVLPPESNQTYLRRADPQAS